MCAPAIAWPQGLTIDSPLDYQVFQRQTLKSGNVLIAGSAVGDGDRVEARFTGGWAEVPYDPAGHTFSLLASTPAGGWYALEVRLLKRREVIAEAKVPHVGVGEVFVIAGQSNATNYGEVKQQTESGMVASFSGTGWQIANDPQPGVQDNSTKGSFIPAFGDAMYTRYHLPIGVACVGHGSTSVRQWLPKGDRFAVPPTMGKFVLQTGPAEWQSTGELFAGLVSRMRQLKTNGFRAVLWHQGESDAHQRPERDITAAEYRRMLERVIRQSRQEAGWDMPWFVAQATYHSPADPSCPPIREAQASLWKDGIALQGPDTDQLTSLNRQNNGQGVHFSTQGLKAHGELWAEKVGAYLDTLFGMFAAPGHDQKKKGGGENGADEPDR
jgi:hypothetical protein